MVSKTAPGPVKLTFDAKLGKKGSQQQQTQDFSIVKSGDDPQILAFYSDPPEGVQNLPGAKVILRWRTYKLGNRKLFQVGVADPLTANFGKDEGSYTVRSVTTDMSFRLVGSPPPDERTLMIGVLSPGWFDVKNVVSEGDPGYPDPLAEEDGKFMALAPEIELEPVELFNANNQLLYGTFRYKLQDQESAFLFQTENPFARWRMVKTDSGDNASIPPGFSTSPGVYFDDKVWLIGGSQINPDLTSNTFCYFDTVKKVWQPAQTAPWRARMGHAVLLFREKIWLMGGRDAFGNA